MSDGNSVSDPSTLVQKPPTEVVRITTSGCLLDLWPCASKLSSLLVPWVVHLKGEWKQ